MKIFLKIRIKELEFGLLITLDATNLENMRFNLKKVVITDSKISNCNIKFQGSLSGQCLKVVCLCG